MNKIILADNQAIFRAGTAKILAMEDDFRIIAQCPDPERLYQALDAFRGVMLIFAATLVTDLTTLSQRVARAGSRSIAILENSDSPARFLSAGVEGLMYRNVSSPVLIDCVRQVGAGGQFQQAASNEVSHLHEDAVGARVRDRLTLKEMKIVALIVQGCKNKEIAMKLGTTEQVVKNYLRNVYDKTGVSDRLELALFTIHHKMLADAAAAVGNEMMGVLV
nr:response regulator transcription factor [Acidobacterium sp. S8]